MPNERANVLPYVVPATYPLGEPGWSRPLGHDVHVVLVERAGRVVTPIRSDALAKLGLRSVEACWDLALANIEDVFKTRMLAQMLPPRDPAGLSLILCGNDWFAASCIVMKTLHAWAAKQHGDGALLAAIPNPEALLLFRRGTDEQIRDVCDAIRRAESDHRKPITWSLFELSAGGVRPYAAGQALARDR